MKQKIMPIIVIVIILFIPFSQAYNLNFQAKTNNNFNDKINRQATLGKWGQINRIENANEKELDQKTPLFNTGEIQRIKVYGEQKREGFIEENDQLYVVVDARILNEETNATVLPENLKVNYQPFTTCNITGTGWYECYYTPGMAIDFSSYTTLPELNIELSDDIGPLATETARAVVDKLGPIVNTFNSDKTITGVGEDVTFSIDLTDRAYEDGTEGVGIKAVHLYTNNGQNLLLTKLYNDSTRARVQDSIIWTPTAAENGNNTICLIGEDYFHSPRIEDKKCLNIWVDAEAPIINTTSFKLLMNNYQVQYYTGPTTFSAIVNITEPNELTEVRADFTALVDTQETSEYNNRIADSCIENSDNIYTCTWYSIPLVLSSSTTLNVPIQATDQEGNTATTTADYTIELETEGPQIIFFGSIFQDPTNVTKSYVRGTNNTIVLEMEPAASGYSNRNVYADLRYLSGETLVRANVCLLNNTWKCYWKNIDTTASHDSELTIYSSASTDAGNNYPGVISSVVKVDLLNPVINSVKIYAIGGSEYDEPRQYYTAGDYIAVTLNITDTSPIEAVGNFSQIISTGNYTSVPGECNKENNNWICTWEIDRVIDDGIAGRKQIIFSINDTVKNSQVLSQPINISLPANGQAPNCWKLVVEKQSPDVIDRRTASIMPNGVDVYSDIKLSGQICEALTIQKKDCQIDSRYVSGVDFADYGQEQRKPMLITNLQQTNFKLDTVNVTCTLLIMSQYPDGGAMRLTGDQEENVTITIPFYNSPLGEVNEEVLKKIKKTKEQIDKLKWATKLEETLQQMQKMCKMFQQINQLSSGLSGGSSGLSIAEATAQLNNPQLASGLNAARGTPGMQGAAQQLTTTNKGTLSSLQNICGFVNCQSSDWGLDSPFSSSINGMLDKWKTFGMPGTQWDTTPSLGNSGSNTATGGTTGNLGGAGTPSAGGDAGTETQKQGMGNMVTKGEQAENQAYMASLLGEPNPTDNIYLAVFTLCLPGIIHNVEKYRQILCSNVICMERGIPEQGMTMAQCEAYKQTAVCQFFVGPIFELIGANWIFQLTGVLMNGFKDSLMLGVDMMCDPMIATPGQGMPAIACQAAAAAGMIESLGSEIKDLTQEKKNMCDEMENPTTYEDENTQEREDRENGFLDGIGIGDILG